MDAINEEIMRAYRNRCEISIGCLIQNIQYLENVINQFKKFSNLSPEYIIWCRDPAEVVRRIREMSSLRVFVGTIEDMDNNPFNALAGKMSMILDQDEIIDYSALRKYLEKEIIDKEVAKVNRNGEVKIINRLTDEKTEVEYDETLSSHSKLESCIIEDITEIKDPLKLFYDGVELDIEKMQIETNRLIDEGVITPSDNLAQIQEVHEV